MKLSFVVPVPERNKDLKEFYQRLTLLKKLGYDGVELAIRNPEEIKENQVRTLIDELKLKVSAIATGSGLTKDGLSFCHPNKSIRKKAIARIKSHIELASRFNAQVIIGLIRGNPKKGVTEKRAYQWIIGALKECGKFAAEHNTILALEAINRYEIDLIHTLKDAQEIIEKTGRDSIGILADTFHMNIEEKSIPGSLNNCGSYISHVHVADNNRLAPGQGCLDFSLILDTLQLLDYDGFLSVELVPVKPDFATAAKQAVRHLRPLMDEL